MLYMYAVASRLFPFTLSIVTMPYTSLSFSAYELPTESGAITIKLKFNTANSNTGSTFIVCNNEYMSIYILR